MDLSIVATLYYSAAYIEEFHARVSSAAQQITSDYEIILVDDGSPDNSLEVALSLVARDPKVRVLELSRNFGHHKAIMTGLDHAKGDLVFLIDSDLEEAPELLSAFHASLKSERADVVYGVQKSRRGGWFERVSGGAFYWMFNLLSTYPVPPNLVTARLMTREYVRALVQHKDREIFLAGLWAITGFRQIASPVDKEHKGRTTYSFVRRVVLLVNAVTSFSSRPLIFIFYLGSAVMSLSAFAGMALIVRYLFFAPFLQGWASLMVSIWFLGGLTIFCVGIVGIYLSRVYSETKERPYTIIRQFHEYRRKVTTEDSEEATKTR